MVITKAVLGVVLVYLAYLDFCTVGNRHASSVLPNTDGEHQNSGHFLKPLANLHTTNTECILFWFDIKMHAVESTQCCHILSVRYSAV